MPFFIIYEERTGCTVFNPVISVDLLNSFLPEVWYSLVLGTGETTQKGDTAMAGQPDIIWNEQCLGIQSR